MATKRLETEKLGMDCGEGDFVVSEVCPVNGLKRSVTQELAGVSVEVVQWLGEGCELKGNLWSNKPHALIGKMTTIAKHWDGGIQ